MTNGRSAITIAKEIDDRREDLQAVLGALRQAVATKVDVLGPARQYIRRYPQLALGLSLALGLALGLRASDRALHYRRA